MTDENDGDPVIVLQNPVIIKYVQNSTGILVKVKPWIELSNEDFFIIKLDKIITMTETKDTRLIEIYDRYLNNENDITNIIDAYGSNGRVNVTDKMGYISSVNDARKKLENLYNNTKEI
jgi:hypothetical protein